MAAKADKRGMKRICTGCGTHFYDFERRPIVCPSCDVEFTGEAKLKTRRTKAPANDEIKPKAKEGIAAKAIIPAEDEIEDVADADVISLDEVAEVEDLDDEDAADVKIDLDDDTIDDLAEVEDDEDLEEEIDVDLDDSEA